MAATKPNLWQYIAYSYGRCLPDSMRSWVAEGLADVRAVAGTGEVGATPAGGPSSVVATTRVGVWGSGDDGADLYLGLIDIACTQ